jgi:hypothetical protein
MRYSVAATEQTYNDLRSHLTREDGQEDLCFAIWHPSKGKERNTAILRTVLRPGDGDRQVHGNTSFNSSFFDRAMGEALAVGGGIAFLHSHPGGVGWQKMSQDDIVAEQIRLAPSVWGATKLPLVGLTLGTGDGILSARFWERIGPKKYGKQLCESVRVVGEGLSISYGSQVTTPRHRKSQVRTVAAWGPEAQDRLARLKVGIVGLGSVGSVVAEALARTGVQRIQLIDYQAIEEANLDRTLHATERDARRRSPKVTIAARAMRRSATANGFKVQADEFSICEEEGYRRALDCDVLFSCVDRPWARSVLNFIAYAHLIPVIDGGILVNRTSSGSLRGASWKAHVVGPSYRCLRCLGQYEAGLVEADRRGDLDNTSYIESLPEVHPARANENVFGFSLSTASLEFLQLLMLVVQPLGLRGGRPQNYHLLTGQIDLGGTECDSDCPFPELIATGDSHHPGTGRHVAAEVARMERSRPSWSRWLRKQKK